VEVADRTGRRVGEADADLHGAGRAGRRQLHDAESVVRPLLVSAPPCRGPR
jgi:hypothetical protein